MITCPDCKNPVAGNAARCDRCGFLFNPQSGSLLLYQSDSTGDRPMPSGSSSSSLSRTGGALPGTCSACGFANTPGEMFCQRCGVQLPPVTSAPPPPPQRASRPVDGSASNEDSVASESASGISHPILSGPLQVEKAANGKLLLRENGIGIQLPVTLKEIIIGRSDPVVDIYPDIDLSDHDAERKGVSRRHARIMIDQSKSFIEDLNSTNFTFLNRQRLEPGRRYLLNSGDEIRLGLFVMDYLSDSPS